MSQLISIVGGSAIGQQKRPDTHFNRGGTLTRANQTVGRDHFPLMASTLPANLRIGDGSFFTEVIDAETACRWCYRVKKWRLHIDYTFHDSFGTSFSGSIQLDYQDQITSDAQTFRLPKNESEWSVMSRTDNIGANVEIVGDGDFTYFDQPPESGDAVVDNVLQSRRGDDNVVTVFLTASQPAWRDGVVCQFLLHGGAGNQEFGTLAAEFNSDVLSDRVVGTLYIDGDQIVTSIYAIDDDLSLGADNPLDSLNATLKPIKFWPYSNSKGDPVYDEDTGEQLVDPFS